MQRTRRMSVRSLGVGVFGTVLALAQFLLPTTLIASSSAQTSRGQCVVFLDQNNPDLLSDPLTTTFEQCATEVARIGDFGTGAGAFGKWATYTLQVDKNGRVYYAGVHEDRFHYWGKITVNQDMDRDGVLASVDKCPAQPETVNGFSDLDGCPDSLEELVQLAIADIDDFWQQTFESEGVSYIPPTRFVAYTRRSASRTISACGRIVPNNAAYCSRDHSIYYDMDMLNRMFRDFGDYAVVVVIAHEWAHSIQAQVYDTTTVRWTIFQELEADCLAGAYTLHLITGRSNMLSLEPGDIEEGIFNLYNLGDDLA